VSIVAKMIAIDGALDEAGIPHAFGGALALAFCTERARGTIDIDLNVFLVPSRIDELIAALPGEVEIDDRSSVQLARDGQTRAWWESTPVDLFLSTTPYHDEAASRSRYHELGGRMMPFLDCSDLAVFKAFFDRPKDWVDLAEMNEAGTLEADRIVGILARYLGPEDHRVARVLEFRHPSS
jgi:hypothetical protein